MLHTPSERALDAHKWHMASSVEHVKRYSTLRCAGERMQRGKAHGMHQRSRTCGPAPGLRGGHRLGRIAAILLVLRIRRRLPAGPLVVRVAVCERRVCLLALRTRGMVAPIEPSVFEELCIVIKGTATCPSWALRASCKQHAQDVLHTLLHTFRKACLSREDLRIMLRSGLQAPGSRTALA